jgi:Family of unknown function (DUF6062)
MPLAEFQQAILQECMQQQGCPLCRAVWKIDGTRFDWYVNDGVLDEETLRNVVRTVGFCAPHASYLSLIEGNDFLWSHLGSCMVYIHVIEYALLPDLERMLTRSGNSLLQPFRRHVFSPLRHLFHHDLCPLCFDHRQHERTYREQFVKAFCTSEEFRQAYLQADCLCVPHFQQVRSALSEQRLVQLLDVAEVDAVKRYEQASPSAFQRELKQCLCLLYGGETILWTDLIPRAAIHASEANPVSCPACQETEQEIPQLLTTFLNHLVTAASFEEGGEQGALSLCSWHAGWLFNQSARQPAIFSRLEPVLHRTCSGLLHQVEARNMRHQACHLCAWLDEQVKLQVEKLQRQLGDSRQQVQLCLPHARAVLRQSRDEETQKIVALALLRSVVHVGKRLEGYVYKCTERFQDQMQPDEQVAWFDAIRWFGGSESSQFLLLSSPATETSGK